ncbi:hypothetical protein [Polyangium jinanense]|uniref:Uncharacterized protein n=1 Tax=Polyangium jinanense TaxID=2829994 RepID=A0A9X4AP91_9BACT|nr:hypothetical protein [Polyangium jinanense]MDC3953116.1 hypothetical protein [Polyangium jinanense]MDC3979763.1 hypothetical protein [Polyangium jinanense]
MAHDVEAIKGPYGSIGWVQCKSCGWSGAGGDQPPRCPPAAATDPGTGTLDPVDPLDPEPVVKEPAP